MNWEHVVEIQQMVNGYFRALDFAAGGVLMVHLVRTSARWRMSEMSNRVVWRAGGGCERVLATGAPKVE